MIFIEHFWHVVAHRQLLDLYKKHKPRGSFFQLTGEAILREFLLLTAHMIHEAEEIVKNYPVGEEAKATLEELKAVYAKGDTYDRTATNFPDCGIKIYRDKVLGHPLNNIKAILGKGLYEIHLKWETIDHTFALLRQFCTDVESEYSDEWKTETAKDEIIGLDAGFLEILYALLAAEELKELKLAVVKRGRPRIRLDWQADRFVLEDDDEGKSGSTNGH
ncbi:MAG TPA: hypothetical protein VFE62_02685 [Gemmataceae bacterium]|nr:hypothetical protein [Gemmataceae bacterium]